MSVCGVLNCKINYRNAKKSGQIVSFHRLPEKNEIKREWMKLCLISENEVPTAKKRRICSLHFSEEDFVGDRLLPSAVPSKLLPCDETGVKEQLAARDNLELQVADLKKTIKGLKAENSRLRTEVENYSREASIYKNVVDRILTPLQLRILKKGLKKVKWTESEMAKAMLLKKISSKAYALIQIEWNIPLPSERSIRRWCSEIDFQPGILHTILRLLREKFSDEPLLYRQCVMGMDEMSINSEIAYEPKQDLILGPFKKMMVVCIRGLFKSWKQPIYFNFNVEMSKEWLYEIIILQHLMQKDTIESVEDRDSREVSEACIVLENINNYEQIQSISSENWQDFNGNLNVNELCQFGGEEYLAGYIASKINESWMRLSPDDVQRNPQSWCQITSRGNLHTPSYTWLNQFRELNKHFNDFHKTQGKYSYNPCKGVIRLLQDRLILWLPHIETHVIKVFVRVRTFIRIKYLNGLRLQKSQVEYRRRLLRSNS